MNAAKNSHSQVDTLRDIEPLQPSRLYRSCDLDHLPFTISTELTEIGAEFAHARAVEALRFGLQIRQPGYNLFVLGDPGSGRHAVDQGQ